MKWLQQCTDECPYSFYTWKEVKCDIISNSKTKILCDLKRSYHIHLGGWRWHESLHSRAPESYEGVTIVQHQGKVVLYLGTIKDPIWLPCGHVNRKGDPPAWKARPASYRKELKVKVYFCKQWGKLNILEKREAACYWQTELGELGLNLASVLWYLCSLG